MRELIRWSSVLRRQFGERVQKVSLDIGAGCPNREGLRSGGCIFCDERGGGSGSFLKGLSLEEQILKGIEGAKKHYKTRSIILYFQSYSATNLPLCQFRSAVEEALQISRQQDCRVCALSVGTRPDLLPPHTLEYLDGLCGQCEVWLELGVQTIDPAGLVWLNRGHGMDATEEALARLSQSRLKVCAHLITGLSGEAEHQLAQSALWLAGKGIHAFKFHPLHVLKNTRLEELYRAGNFMPISKETYLRRLTEALAELPDGIILQRLTAGARPSCLVAPLWVLEKEPLEREIERRFYEKVAEMQERR